MERFIDLTGQTFGLLTVLKKTERKASNGTFYWECQCKCGNICEANGSCLRKGTKKSCGCSSRDLQSQSRTKNLIGQIFQDFKVIEKINTRGQSRWKTECVKCGREKIFYSQTLKNNSGTVCNNCKWNGEKYGRLTIIGRDYEKSKKEASVYCKCDCGKIISVLRSNLLSGNTTSCGCFQKENAHNYRTKDLTGLKFGRLTALSCLGPIKENAQNNYWMCKCSCGSIVTVNSSKLIQGSTKSCGCLRSLGESSIEEYLKKFNIDYKKEYNEKGMKLSSGFLPRYDFAIFKNNKLKFLLEYNGEQHYKYTGGWNNKENFLVTQQRDKEKIQIAKDFSYPLEFIKYTDYDNIESILDSLLIKYDIKGE